MTKQEKAMIILEKLDGRSMNISWFREDEHIRDIVDALVEIEKKEAQSETEDT